MANKPDYDIHVLNKATKARSRIGVGWNKPDGCISISFDQFIDLNLVKGPEVVVTAFPNDPALKAKRFRKGVGDGT